MVGSWPFPKASNLFFDNDPAWVEVSHEHYWRLLESVPALIQQPHGFVNSEPYCDKLVDAATEKYETVYITGKVWKERYFVRLATVKEYRADYGLPPQVAD